MKILITGSNGQLGSQLYQTIGSGGNPKPGHVLSADLADWLKNVEVVGADSSQLDITRKDQVTEFISTARPDILINCAAYTSVDECERDRERAYQVNALGARNLAMAAEQIGASLIHISTDYVFDGQGKKPYHEGDICNPQGIYGLSKHLGEQYVRDFCSRYLIVRTAWLYGHGGTNFVKRILRIAKEKGELHVVNDQIGTPTNTVDLSYHILKLAAAGEYGIFHCSGAGQCSWYEFACEVIRLSGISCSVIPCTSLQYGSLAKRPTYAVLENRMLSHTIGDQMRPWQDALTEFMEEMKKSNAY